MSKMAQLIPTIGDLRRTSLSIVQAAHVLDMDVDRLRKALDRNTVAGIKTLKGKRQLRRLDGLDLLYFRMQPSLKRDLLRRVYFQLKGASDSLLLDAVVTSATDDKAAGPIVAYVSNLAAETVTDIASAEDYSRYVDETGMIHGADVEALRIAALVRGGTSVEDVLADYPCLSRDQIDAAVRYARANPKQGRPFPSSTVKSVLRESKASGLAAAFAAAREHDA